MPRRLFKVPLVKANSQFVQVHIGATILEAVVDDNTSRPCLMCLGDVTQPLAQRRILMGQARAESPGVPDSLNIRPINVFSWGGDNTAVFEVIL